MCARRRGALDVTKTSVQHSIVRLVQLRRVRANCRHGPFHALVGSTVCDDEPVMRICDEPKYPPRCE